MAMLRLSLEESARHAHVQLLIYRDFLPPHQGLGGNQMDTELLFETRGSGRNFDRCAGDPVCGSVRGDALLQRRAPEHGRTHAQLRDPARPLDAEPARGRAREHGDGPGLAGASVPPDRGGRGPRHRLLQPRPGGDGPERRFREDPAQRGARLCPHRLQGHPDRGAPRLVHEHVRLDGELRRRLRRQRHLQDGTSTRTRRRNATSPSPGSPRAR